jgi:hypothetical protein
VRRATALAFPSDKGNVWEILAHYTFLSALRDEGLRQSILERDPQMFDDAALKMACHFVRSRDRRPNSRSTIKDVDA